MTDATFYNVTTPHISRTPDVRGGKPVIAGTGVKVQNVYIWHELNGMSASEIAEQYHLTLGQVYAALTYAYDHLDIIKADIAESERAVAAFQQEHTDKVKTSFDE